jgi:hypothetical protein
MKDIASHNVNPFLLYFSLFFTHLSTTSSLLYFFSSPLRALLRRSPHLPYWFLLWQRSLSFALLQLFCFNKRKLTHHFH